jgi:YggT family protein
LRATRNARDGMHPIFALIYVILDIYKWVLIASVILSWLVALNVVNTYNRIVNIIGDVLWRLTEPVLRPIRQFIPSVGGLDLSPLVALLLVWFLQYLIVYYG